MAALGYVLPIGIMGLMAAYVLKHTELIASLPSLPYALIEAVDVAGRRQA